jgi:integrase
MKALTEQQRRARDRAADRARTALARRPTSAFGSLRVLPSGRIQARYFGPDERRYTAPLTFDTLTDADEWLAVVRGQIALGTWVSPDARPTNAPRARMTLDQVFAAYMDEGDLKPRTRDIYTYQWERLIRADGPHVIDLGNRDAATLTPSDVAEWRASLPPAPRQRQQAVDLLRAVLNLAIERTELASNPATTSRRKTQGKVVRRRDPKRTFRLTREQVETLADAMPVQYRFAVLLSAGTGVRFGELAALRRSDLTILRDDAKVMTRARLRIERAVSLAKGPDGRKAVVEGTPKTDAGIRTVAIPSRLHDELETHLSKYAARGADGLLFPGPSGGHLTSSVLYGEKPGVRKHGKGRQHPSKGRGWFRARVEAGLPNARWHLLRHTAISEAVDAGARPADLLARFGHTDLATSAIYQHSAAEADDNLADRL